MIGNNIVFPIFLPFVQRDILISTFTADKKVKKMKWKHHFKIPHSLKTKIISVDNF